MSTNSTPEFGRIRSFLWPIHRFELKRFVPMLLIYALIVFNYSVLRAAKDALVITARSSGAEAIPFIKVWAILPMAIVFTYLFTRLCNRFDREKVFYLMMTIFLGFFFLFATVLYPFRDSLHPHSLADSLQSALPSGFKGLITIFRNWTFTLFYVMSELWGTTIMTVLFWGYANEVTSVKDAKRFYAILGVGANIASIGAGQISVLLSQDIPIRFFRNSDSWGNCLMLITSVVLITGLLTMYLFRYLNRHVKKSSPKILDEKTPKMSMRKNFAYLAKSKYLICIAIIVLGYNIGLNMIEIVWKDQIKMLYPNAIDYNAYMGKVMMAMGVFSTFIAMFITGSVIRRFGWTFSALITPIILLVTGLFFFAFLLFKDTPLMAFTTILGTTPLALGVFFGSMQNCFSRSCKYTLFDTTKEMSFIPLGSESKLKGKAAIDGVGSRLGKSGGSLIHQALLLVFGSVSLSTPYIGVILLGVITAWIYATKSLGKRFNTLTEQHQKISIPDPDPDPVSPVKQEALG